MTQSLGQATSWVAAESRKRVAALPPRASPHGTRAALPQQRCRWSWKRPWRVCEEPPPSVPRTNNKKEQQPQSVGDTVAVVVLCLVMFGFKVCIARNKQALGIGVRRQRERERRAVQQRQLQRAIELANAAISEDKQD
jgi:hypothetical protein